MENMSEPDGRAAVRLIWRYSNWRCYKAGIINDGPLEETVEAARKLQVEHQLKISNELESAVVMKSCHCGLTSNLVCYGAPREIRTPDLLIRSQSLYPTELWAHV
jgi:hypothetical protein